MINMMMSEYDKTRMKNDVEDVINDYHILVDIWTPKSIEDQTKWNKYLRENPDGLEYDKELGVKVEKVSPSRNSEKIFTKNVGGDRFDGSIIINIPNSVTYTDQSIIVYNSERYRISNVIARIGEDQVTISKMVGEQ